MSDGPRHTLAAIAVALSYISPDCDRDTWVRVLAAIKSEFGEDGYELAREWSARGASFKAADFNSTWKSLRAEGGTTIATLLKLAKEGGYLPDLARRPAPAPAADRTTARVKREAREEALREAKRTRAADEARRRFDAAGDNARAPYLERKGVRAHGVRVEADGTLLVPMRDAAGELRNLQAIDADGRKRFLRGGPVTGLFHALGELDGATQIALAEGYATAATVREATGLPVVCAFNAGNMADVARTLRERWPTAMLVVCADDDRATAARSGKNAGRLAAAECARGGRAVVAIPAPLEDGETDFNDLARRVGLEPVAAIVREALARNTLRVDPAERRAAGVATADAADDGDAFVVDERGVHFLKRDRDGRATRDWVCAKLDVRARTCDADGGAWGYFLVFDDPAGTRKALAIPARLLAGDGTELRARLADEGLEITPGPSRNRLAHYIVSRRPARRVRCVEMIGWHGDGFVLPAKSYGPGAADLHYQAADERPRNYFRLAGTLEDWRRNVAALCVGNPRLVFLVALAFAGPCLYLVEGQSGGFHFYGASSKGKTTALAISASVWGRPEVGGYIRSWRATGNALEATAAAFSDTLLLLDEMREAAPGEIVQTVLMLGNGQGKQRMRSGGAPRAPHTWRVQFASTGERTVPELAALVGMKVDAGAGVRLVEIPVPEAGMFGDLHGAADGAAFADTLRAAALRAYGVAGDAWLDNLANHRDEARAFLRECSTELLDAWLQRSTDAGQTQRVAARFALVAAAGELATRAGPTGWSSGESERAAAQLFGDWIAARGTRGDAEALAALRQVAALLGQHAESYFPWWHRGADDHRPNAPKRWGFRRRVDDDGNEIVVGADDKTPNEQQAEKIAAKFYILVSAWRGEICAGFDPRYVAGVLHRRGHLVAESDKAGARFDRNERLPGIGHSRCYVVQPSIFEDSAL